jgi:adenylate kinase
MIIVLLGPPGAGKGTQGDLIAQRIDVPRTSTGDILRAAARDGTTLGLKAKEYMDRGDLVPDTVILGIIKQSLESPQLKRGAILDGVVRTERQAEGLNWVLKELGRKLDAVLLFEASDDELVRRLSARTTCETCQTPYTGVAPGTICPKCGGTVVRRQDDEPESVKRRLEVYREQTAPVIDWYKHDGTRICTVDAIGTLDDVTRRALSCLGR